MRKFMLMLALPAALLVAVGACGDDDDDDSGGDDDAAETQTEPADDGTGPVDVRLQEFAVVPSATSHEPGAFDFNVENGGPEDVHELVVIKTDLPANALPTVADGSVAEAGEGIEVIAEVEGLEVDATATLAVDLEAGSYVLLCNIVEEEDGETIVHYQQGMRTLFTVE